MYWETTQCKVSWPLYALIQARTKYASVPYIVGINPNSPQNPHSAPASGGTDIGNIDTSPPTEAYVIYGGVVGGPDKNDDFWDERKDWVQTEVSAIDKPGLLLAPSHILACFDLYTSFLHLCASADTICPFIFAYRIRRWH
jgi:hypothetical protein